MSFVTDSEFRMWRAVFAIAHTDGFIAQGEIQYMAEALEDTPFSAEQERILNEDIKNPQDVIEIFTSISEEADKVRFFKFAHDMVWSDGHYHESERMLVDEVKRLHTEGHIKGIGGLSQFELEDEKNEIKMPPTTPKRSFSDIIRFFRHHLSSRL